MSLFKRCAHKGRFRDNCDHPWWATVRVNRQRVQQSLEVYFKRRVRGRGSKLLARELDETLHRDVKSGKYYEQLQQDADLQIPKSGLTFDAFLDIYEKKY